MHEINYVGVDLSKLELVADLAAEARPRAFAHTPDGHRALLAALPAGAHVVCEASGGYERALTAALHAAGVPVSVVMPRRVREFAHAAGLRAKTDPIDARLLSVNAREDLTHLRSFKIDPPPNERRGRLFGFGAQTSFGCVG